MADIENKCNELLLDGAASGKVAGVGRVKMAVALVGGSGLVLLSIMAMASSTGSGSVAQPLSLVGLQTPMRQTMLPRAGVQPRISTMPGYSSQLQSKMSQLGVPSNPYMNLAITAIEATKSGDRDISMKAQLKTVLASMDDADKEKVEKEAKAVAFKAADLKAGITGPFGFFDPAGVSADLPEGRILFYREVEIKHGRVGMLAFLGCVVGEQFHPLFGGNIDVPAAFAFQQTPLQTFWPAVVALIAIPEIFSVAAFENPFGELSQFWQVKTGRVPGDLKWDPLGLKPKDPAGLLEMQNKELNNGRLAMLAAAGILAQELVTGQKVFGA